MQPQQLIETQRAIEQFFYRVRVNVALHYILNSKDHDVFKGKIKSAIEKQVVFFATVDKINEIVGVKKADGRLEDEGGILDNIDPLFLGILTFVAASDIKRYLEYSAERGGQAAYTLLSKEGSYTVSPSVDKVIDERVPKLTGFVDGTTKKWLSHLVARGVAGGLSNYEIARLVRNQAKKISILRSEVIAENEAAVFLGEAALDVYSDNGVDFKKLVTSRDERVCPICLADEEAGEIPMKDSFPSGSVFTPVHIGCRCFVLPVTRTPIQIEP